MPIPYTGEALKTYERIHVLRAYHYNKLYISPDKIIYHINRHGFLHAYTAGKCKDYDGSKIYYIRDNLLTRENLLRESLTTFYRTKEEAKAAWESMQADAEANTAEERPQETATADGTTAGGESITTTETEPQRAAERPQADAEPHHPANDQERQESAQDCQTENKTTGRPQQTATDREEYSPQEPATAGTHKTATTAAKKTTSGQTNTRTDKAPQEATQRPKRGTHSPATYEAQETAAESHRAPETVTTEEEPATAEKDAQRATERTQKPATDQEKKNRIPRNAKKIYITWLIDTSEGKAGDHDTVEKTERGWIGTTATGKNYFMFVSLLRNGDAVQVDRIETDSPQETATQPAGDQETQRPANDQEHPQTTASQTAEASQSTHKPATSPTEARNAHRRTNYHHRRKNATQSHAGSPQEIRSARTCHRWKQRTPLPYSPQPIRSAADCHRRNLPQCAQQAPQRTEPAQAIHAPPCHRKSHHKPHRDAVRTYVLMKTAFSGNKRISCQFFGKFSGYPVLHSFFEKSNQKPCGGYMKGYHGGIKK